MENRRSSLIDTASIKNFIQSCPYRNEDIDHNILIKRQDMESCLKRLSHRDDIYGVIITTMDGRILYECESLNKWIPVLAPLCSFAQHLIRNNDPMDNIQSFRLRTKTYEILITIHNEQLLIVMQMLSNNNNIDINNVVEEDWETFLKRLHASQMNITH